MDELEFVRQIISRDRNAWDELISRYSRLIYSFILRTFKLKGLICMPEEADDLCHDVFLKLAENDFEKLKSFKARNGCKFASWLRQVTVNHALTYLRKNKLLQSLDEEGELGLSMHEFLPSQIKSSRDNATESELFSELKDCMSRLEQDELRLIELAFYQQATIEELETIYRLKRTVLDMRKSRATAKLRDCMQKKGFLC